MPLTASPVTFHESTSEVQPISGADVLTLTASAFTIAATTNRLLVVQVFGDFNVGVASVTWDGTTMTVGPDRRVSPGFSNRHNMQIFYLAGADATTGDIVATLDFVADGWGFNAFVLGNVRQNDPMPIWAGGNEDGAAGPGGSPESNSGYAIYPNVGKAAIFLAAVSDGSNMAYNTASGRAHSYNSNEDSYPVVSLTAGAGFGADEWKQGFTDPRAQTAAFTGDVQFEHFHSLHASGSRFMRGADMFGPYAANFRYTSCVGADTVWDGGEMATAWLEATLVPVHDNNHVGWEIQFGYYNDDPAETVTLEWEFREATTVRDSGTFSLSDTSGDSIQDRHAVRALLEASIDAIVDFDDLNIRVRATHPTNAASSRVAFTVMDLTTPEWTGAGAQHSAAWTERQFTQTGVSGSGDSTGIFNQMTLERPDGIDWIGHAPEIDTSSEWNYAIIEIIPAGHLSHSTDAIISAQDGASQAELWSGSPTLATDSGRTSGATSVSNGELFLGDDYRSFVRFDNVTIPQGYEVVKAWVQFTHGVIHSEHATGGTRSEIGIFNEDDSALLVGNTDWDARAKTAAIFWADNDLPPQAHLTREDQGGSQGWRGLPGTNEDFPWRPGYAAGATPDPGGQGPIIGQMWFRTRGYQPEAYPFFQGNTTNGQVFSRWKPMSRTPDISDEVQVVINRSGWASGQAIQVFIENVDTFNQQTDWRIYGFNASAPAAVYNPATLNIIYREPIPPPDETHTTDALIGVPYGLPKVRQSAESTAEIMAEGNSIHFGSIPNDGNLLLIGVSAGAINGNAPVPNFTTPAGWTSEGTDFINANAKMEVFSKTADGTEADRSIQIKCDLITVINLVAVEVENFDAASTIAATGVSPSISIGQQTYSIPNTGRNDNALIVMFVGSGSNSDSSGLLMDWQENSTNRIAYQEHILRQVDSYDVGTGSSNKEDRPIAVVATPIPYLDTSTLSITCKTSQSSIQSGGVALTVNGVDYSGRVSYETDAILVPDNLAEDNITAQNDDGSVTTNIFPANDVVFGDGGTSQYSAYYRFETMNIPVGATIRHATINHTMSNPSQLSTEANQWIHADTADDSAQMADFTDWNSRVRTTARKPLNVGFVDGIHVDDDPIPFYPNIAPVIQEVTKRSGWASGNAIQIIYQRYGSATSGSHSIRINGFAEAPNPDLKVWFDTGTFGEHTTNALLVIDILTKNHSTDAILKAEGTTRTHTADADIQIVVTETHTADAIKQATLTQTHTTDAITPDRLALTQTTDSIKLATQTDTYTTDAILRATIERAHTSDAIVVDRQTQTHTADALKVVPQIARPDQDLTVVGWETAPTASQPVYQQLDEVVADPVDRAFWDN